MTEAFKKKIIEEMGVSYTNAMEKNFDLAKTFMKITEGGTVDVIKKDDFKVPERILLYLIGKRYAKEAGRTGSEFASWKELSGELGMTKGSVLPGVKTLRDTGKIESKKGKYSIKANFIETTLKKLSKRQKNG